MKLRVQKFDPQIDASPYFVEGEVEWHEGITALDAIYLFHTNVEPVSFDYSCGSRICGQCAAMVDGEPQLMCISLLSDEDHMIEPLAGFPIIRDLVVDKTPLEESISKTAQRVMTDAITIDTVAPSSFDAQAYEDHEKNYMLYIERCSRCGLCMAGCPALASSKENYVGPAVMLQVAFRQMDWYDQGSRIPQAVSGGLYRCVQCGLCDDVCPMNIPHLAIWQMLRDQAQADGLVPLYAQQ